MSFLEKNLEIFSKGHKHAHIFIYFSQIHLWVGGMICYKSLTLCNRGSRLNSLYDTTVFASALGAWGGSSQEGKMYVMWGKIKNNLEPQSWPGAQAWTEVQVCYCFWPWRCSLGPVAFLSFYLYANSLLFPS